jgi:peptide/nickel transport system permease protein
MVRFVAKRAATSVVVLFALTVVTFVLTRMIPTNPAALYVGPQARPEEIERARIALGLDQPLPVQYWKYLSKLVTGDWGTSIATKRPVLSEMADRLPATLDLVLAAILLATLVGVILGVLSARYPGGILDAGVRVLSIGGVSMPAFWLGLLLQVIFVGRLHWLPATGRLDTALSFSNPLDSVTGLALVDSVLTGNFAVFTDAAKHLVLPALTLAAYPTGLIARMTRASMLETLGQDYVLAARAYGLRERRVLWQLALKNAVAPTLSVLGLSLAYALTGTFFVEIVFNWPGIGLFATNSLLSVDYPVIMGITLLGATGYLLINLAVDLVQARLDPRIRLT